MLKKNTASQGVYLLAWDTVNNVGKTGDASNITGSWSLDGGAETAGYTTTHPTEIGGGNYWQPLAQAETNAAKMMYRWSSSTTGIQIDPVYEFTDFPQTGDSFARLGAPAGASIEADIAAIKTDTGAVKVVTDKLGTTIDSNGRVQLQNGTSTGQISLTSGGVTLADTVTHGGSTAKLRLGSSSTTPAVHITHSGSVPAVYVVHSGSAAGAYIDCSTGTGAALALLAGGSAHGFDTAGGSGGGHGIRALGGNSVGNNGDGIHAKGSGNGVGMYLEGGPGYATFGGSGLEVHGGPKASGIYTIGGTGGSTFAGSGIYAAGADGAPGFYGSGADGQAGFYSTATAVGWPVADGWPIVRSGTAQAGSGTTITLDSGASATTNYYQNDLVVTTGGTGAGQARFITAYNGSTKVATVGTWAVNPDNTTTFSVLPFDAISAGGLTAAGIATAVWTDLLAGSDFSTVGSIGKRLADDIDAAISSRLAPTNAGRTLDITSNGNAGIDWANIDNPTTTVGLSGTTIKDVTDVETALTTISGYVNPAVAQIKAQTDKLTFDGSNRVSSNVTAMANNVLTAAAIADGAIDRATFAADTGLQPIRSGTAQAGTALTIKLDTGASSVSDYYKGLPVYLTGGTGAGQVRVVIGYDGSSKNCSVDRLWATAPDNTTTFALLPADAPRLNDDLQVATGVSTTVIRSGTAQAGGSNTITLDAGAGSTDNVYANALVSVTGGTGVGQVRSVVSYNGTTKVATVDHTWVRVPDNTSTFDLLASTNPTLYSDQGVAQTGAAGTITLATTADATDSTYNGSLVTILSGTGSGQTRVIASYVGATRVATTDTSWVTPPDSTSAYAVIPTGSGSGNSNPTGGLDAAGVRAAIGMASANLDAQLAVITTDVGDIAAIKAKTDQLTFTVSQRVDAQVLGMANNVITAAAVATDAIDADALASDAVAEIQSGLATATSQTTILNRIGSFTGTGVNTILGFLKAMASKVASLPSDIGGTFDPATDSEEAIRDRGDAAWVTGGGGGGGSMTIARTTGSFVGTDELTGVSLPNAAGVSGNVLDLLGDDISIGKIWVYVVFTSPVTVRDGCVSVELNSCRLSGQTYSGGLSEGTLRAEGPFSQGVNKVCLGKFQASRFMQTDVRNSSGVDLTNLSILYELERLS